MKRKSKSETLLIATILLVFWVLLLTPTWIALLLYKVSGASGFWETLAIAGLWMYFLGAAQLGLIILGLFITLYGLSEL